MRGEELFSRIGAMIGLAVGIGIMLLIGRHALNVDPLIQGAIFGAGGAVGGGMIGETIYAIRARKN